LRLARFGVPPTKLAADGANAGDYLAHDVIADGVLTQEVSAVFARITGHRLSVKQYAVAGEAQYSLVINADSASPAIEIPIVDTGEGMAQLLPVVVLGCLAKLGRLAPQSVLAVEHPELHLHPAAHAELAEFFCTLVTDANGPECVIETHSENFLLRVQIAIANGDLPADKVIVHWVKALERGSVVDTITFDEAARPQGAGWPPGVFSEDLAQARELLKIRKQKGIA
jgi:predicted ATPase